MNKDENFDIIKRSRISALVLVIHHVMLCPCVRAIRFFPVFRSLPTVFEGAMIAFQRK